MLIGVSPFSKGVHRAGSRSIREGWDYVKRMVRDPVDLEITGLVSRVPDQRCYTIINKSINDRWSSYRRRILYMQGYRSPL